MSLWRWRRFSWGGFGWMSSFICSRYRQNIARRLWIRGCGSGQWLSSWNSCQFRTPSPGLQWQVSWDTTRAQFSYTAPSYANYDKWQRASKNNSKITAIAPPHEPDNTGVSTSTYPCIYNSFLSSEIIFERVFII